jgi:hypothetical protein
VAVPAEGMSTRCCNYIVAGMPGALDIVQGRAAVMEVAAGGDCRMKLSVEAAPGRRAYSDSTFQVRPGSSLDNDRSPPLPVLEGPESPRCSEDWATGSLESWDRWTKAPR